jgi:hypothetical protein
MVRPDPIRAIDFAATRRPLGTGVNAERAAVLESFGRPYAVARKTMFAMIGVLPAHAILNERFSTTQLVASAPHAARLDRSG